MLGSGPLVPDIQLSSFPWKILKVLALNPVQMTPLKGGDFQARPSERHRCPCFCM